ncbi:response regulator [Rhabdobacter roseus]|uniref:CheY-like chemotaxis protein n=1 Tax=Rhabdobacter roseus TaxID=1655419 RepID=A0A840TVK7_9BACT|nr:response regulator [Rhabdobacter roseus]MBB5284158.1 CheY-like chemotaxis protein [Rhabdobacter roseus]
MELPIRCFLIDDDLDDQEIFSMALQDAYNAVTCECANDGVQALEKLNLDQAFIPHFIFIDMNMPRMKGVQCLEEIKKIDRLKHIPIYMYSTSADPSAIAQTRQLGAADFIVKPSTIGALTSTLSKLFQN